MELLNATKMQAGYTLGMQPDGRELLVVAVKGTFRLPKNGEEATLAELQEPLVMADAFSGEPGLSAPIYECDFVPQKPKCDVLLNGTCYAPEGRPAKRVTVSLQVGTLTKSFNVVGDRFWKKRFFFFVGSTKPSLFITMPISYQRAFGGEDRSHKDQAKHKVFMPNPVGVGFHQQLNAKLLNGKPLPNSEELSRPVRHPRKAYRPMGFGPIGRNWDPRPKYAGTYDEAWLENGFPFLPADFKDQYYQAAPDDQQCPYLRGGQEVALTNLTPEGQTSFRLPTVQMPVVFFPRDGGKNETVAVIDTLIIEPDRGRFMIVWRSALPLKKNIFDVVQVVAGVMPKGWYRARELGKTYCSLGELVAAKMRERAGQGV